MSKNAPRWTNEVPNFGKPIGEKKFSNKEKIENEKKLLRCMVDFKEITEQEAEKMLDEYKKSLNAN